MSFIKNHSRQKKENNKVVYYYEKVIFKLYSLCLLTENSKIVDCKANNSPTYTTIDSKTNFSKAIFLNYFISMSKEN